MAEILLDTIKHNKAEPKHYDHNGIFIVTEQLIYAPLCINLPNDRW